MQELLLIIDEFKKTSSRTEKETLLKKYKENKIFRSVLDFVYDPFIVSGISNKKINKKPNVFTDIKINDIIELIKYVKENNTGRLIDVAVIYGFLDTLKDENLVNLTKEIITKSLKIGLTSNTINKIYGKNTIPSFAVQLAESYAKKGDKIKGEFFVTLKLDGNRCVAIKENGTVKFFTRKGKLIEGMTELEEEFKFLPNNYAYDGELVLANVDNLNTSDLFRATQKTVRKDGIKKNLMFYIFDFLPVEEFKNGKSKMTYKERRNQLDMLIAHTEANYGEIHSLLIPHIEVLPVLYEGVDHREIQIIMQDVIERGYEGLMVNTADGFYQTKRTADLQKVKEFHTADLQCVGMEEGTGKNKGTLGRVNVNYKGNIVGVGSGFTDEERHIYWNHKDDIVGKIIEVQFFEETKDEKTGLPSLRFPVFKNVEFKTIREDKDKDDVNVD